jgi:menaquinone-dependent protoporphyrinogen IX oxidase
MKHILVTYVSHSGSTQEVADFMARQLSASGGQVDFKAISEVTDLSPYNFIAAGGLLYRFGWHPEIAQFLQKNVEVLKAKKVAVFVTGLRLVDTADHDHYEFPIYIDSSIKADPHRKSVLDGITTLKGYLGRALPAIEKIGPVSLAFFGGKLDLNTLKLPEQLIMRALMLLTGMTQGDKRNWEAMKNWINSLEALSLD